MQIKDIIRDVSFIFLMSFMFGFLYGRISSSLGLDLAMPILWGINAMVVVIAFCIVAFWTQEERWKHLIHVGIGTCSISFVNLKGGEGIGAIIGLMGQSIVLVICCVLISYFLAQKFARSATP